MVWGYVFGFKRGIWEKNFKKMVKKMNVFWLSYARVDLWEEFIGVCEWCYGCGGIFNLF